VQTTASHILAEQVLKESQLYSNRGLVLGGDPLFGISLDGLIELANPALCQLLDYRREELLGQSLTLIMGSESLWSAPLEQNVCEDALPSLQIKLYTKFGTPIPTLIAGTLQRDRQGQPERILCSVQDLRQEHWTVEALCQSQARNLAFLQAIPDLIARISRSGIYLDVVPSPGFKHINEHTIGRHLREVLPLETADTHLDRIEAAFASREPQLLEYAIVLRGTTYYYEARIVVCGRDEVLTIVRDITPAKREAAARKQTEAMQSLLAAAVEHADEAIEILDIEACVRYANPAFEALTGFRQADVLGVRAEFLDAPEATPDEILATLQQGLPWQGELAGVRKNGTIYQQEVRIAPVDNADGQIINYVAVRRDITERKRANAALKRYQLLSQHARDIVLFIQPNGRIVEANDAAMESYGYSREELLSLTIHDLQDKSVIAQMDEQMGQDSRYGFLFEATHRRKDDSRFPVEMSLQGASIDGETLILSIIRDITTRKRAEEKLYHNAFHDALTGLPNRSLFLERLSKALAQQQEGEYLFAVLFLDLDGFKVINDSLGHMAGDQLLVELAQRLRVCLEPEDTLARFGGDEFTILLENVTGLEQVTQVADRIQAALADSIQVNSLDIFTTTSIGIVLGDRSLTQPEDLLRSADTALYQAKAKGGTCSAVFDAEMHERAMLRLKLETDLRWALNDTKITLVPFEQMQPHPNFLLHYQPIISLRTQQLAGFEALVRWQHPELGMVSPAEFIPIAEETGLIVPLGWIVLQEACRQMRIWQDQNPHRSHLTMSVNLSVKQFSQPNLVEQVRHVLQATGLKPDRLKLEITESAIMDNAETATRMLGELKALGVQIALDDFGTGYSSLAYLHRLPIDTLKIDRSFVNRVDSDGEQLEITRAIVSLAWNLGMDVVAEGVETVKQLAQLKSLRCEYAQGFFFARPLSAEVAATMISQELHLNLDQA
jgi:diguanylate cyclase (GGDEF)-like protein/PAS domain S-box-containing protein